MKLKITSIEDKNKKDVGIYQEIIYLQRLNMRCKMWIIYLSAELQSTLKITPSLDVQYVRI